MPLSLDPAFLAVRLNDFERLRADLLLPGSLDVSAFVEDRPRSAVVFVVAAAVVFLSFFSVADAAILAAISAAVCELSTVVMVAGAGAGPGAAPLPDVAFVGSFPPCVVDDGMSVSS
jgi:hypothetical protein